MRTRHFPNTSQKRLRLEPTCLMTILHTTSHRLSFLCLFYYLFIYLFIYSFIHSFIHLFVHLVSFYARPLPYVELDYGVMAHAQETKFCVWLKRTGPYYLTADIRGRQFSSLLAAGFWVGVACNRRALSVVLFVFIPPISRKFVPSHSNRNITFRNMLVFYGQRLLVPQVGEPHFIRLSAAEVIPGPTSCDTAGPSSFGILWMNVMQLSDFTSTPLIEVCSRMLAVVIAPTSTSRSGNNRQVVLSQSREFVFEIIQSQEKRMEGPCFLDSRGVVNWWRCGLQWRKRPTKIMGMLVTRVTGC
jgi:hypothetical protein